ncbi:MAG: hypothetical protein IK078_12270 [Lachnospiraceae bacterium]|nr:hypothetical protein [Lachnospiraceae bacterium]
MPKNEKPMRLKKRQKKYLEQFSVYENAQEEDPLYAEKKAVSEALRALNQKLDQLDPYLPDEEEKKKDRQQPGILTQDDLAGLVILYQKAIDQIHVLTLHTEEKIASDKDKQNKAARNAARNAAKANNTLAGQLGKDLAAIQKLADHYEPITLAQVYEMSRINSGYTVVPDKKRSFSSGAQNTRIPVTLRDQDGNEVHGFFTPDKGAAGMEKLLTVVENVKAKYGPAADFFDANQFWELHDKYVKQNKDIIDKILDKKEELSFMPYQSAVAELTRGTSGQPDIAKLIDTPEKLKIYVDVMHAGLKMANELKISTSVGIAPGRNVNRRNAAMSEVAHLLGCDDLLAKSENVRIDIENMEMKGTFMREVKGTDVNRLTPKSKLFKTGPDSADGLELKKKIADLQVIDFLCGNPDRHRGNMIYDISRQDEKNAQVDSFQGIDNDTCLGIKSFDKVGLSAVHPEQMKVITKEMADRILSITPGKLRLMLYGHKLSAKEIAGVENRLTTLQKKIVADQEEYAHGYTKGYLIPGAIKVVDDKELSALSMSEDLCERGNNKSNYFNHVQTLTHTVKNIEKLSESVEKDYLKTLYDATVGCMGNVGRLVEELEEDYKGGGSSSEYNKMMKEMQKLKKSLVAMSGAMIGKEADTSHGHVLAVTKVREQMEKTLAAANEYRYYKYQKKTGEEWMQNPGAHEVTRQERRFHHATDVRDLLTGQLLVFEQLDKKLEACHDFNRKKNDLLTDAENRREEYKNSTEALLKKRNRDLNLYRNHLSRSLYQTKRAFQAIEKAPQEGKMAQKLLFESMVAFTLIRPKPTDKEKMKLDIEKATGQKLSGSIDDLIKRGVACHIVLSAEKVRAKRGKPMTPAEEQLLQDTEGLDLKDLSKAADNLAKQPVFDNFCKYNRDLLQEKGALTMPEVALPSIKKTAAFFDDYKVMANLTDKPANDGKEIHSSRLVKK